MTEYINIALSDLVILFTPYIWALASSSDNLHIEFFATQHRTVTHHMKERAFTLIQNKQPCIFLAWFKHWNIIFDFSLSFDS